MIWSRCVAIVAIACAALQASVLLDLKSWPLDVLSDLRMQLAATCALAGLLAFASASKLVGLSLLISAAIGAYPLTHYLPSPAVVTTARVDVGIQLKLVTLNLNGVRTDQDALRDLLARERPDVVVLTEVTGQHLSLLDEIKRSHPNVANGQLGSLFDTFVLSRWRIVSTEVRGLSPWLPVRSAQTCPMAIKEGVCASIVTLHAPRPIGWRNGAEWRDGALDLAGKMSLRPSGRWRIIVGDLNATPWSPAFKTLTAQAGLRDSALNLGLWTTWPTWLPAWLGIRIDHVLVSESIRVLSYSVGPSVGSGHRPVIVTLLLT